MKCKIHSNVVYLMYSGSRELKYRSGDQNSLGTQCLFAARSGECRDDTSMST